MYKSFIIQLISSEPVCCRSTSACDNEGKTALHYCASSKAAVALNLAALLVNNSHTGESICSYWILICPIYVEEEITLQRLVNTKFTHKYLWVWVQYNILISAGIEGHIKQPFIIVACFNTWGFYWVRSHWRWDLLLIRARSSRKFGMVQEAGIFKCSFTCCICSYWGS